MIKLYFRFIMAAVLSYPLLPVHAALNIEITKSYERATQISVLPFAGDKTALGSIIINDLRRSGQFASSDNPPQVISESTQMNFPLWQQAKIPYTVMGQVKPIASGFEVTFELTDNQKISRLLAERIIVPPNRMREAAHMIADKVFKAITGVSGDFSGRIAYVLKRKINGKTMFLLQVADTDGDRPRTVFTSAEPVLSPTWSPDGLKIAYVSFESRRPVIYLQELVTGKREILTQFKGLNGAPSFSPDGRSLLLTSSKDGNPEIYRLDLMTRSVERLTNHLAIDTEARYAPDGRSFIFTSDRGGSPQIYRYDLATGQIKRLTFRGSFNGRAILSPDNQLLAFVHRTSGQKFQISTQDLATGIITVISPTKLDESPAFSPNGKMLAYATVSKTGRGVLAIVSSDGQFSMELPSQDGEISDPSWAPRNP